MVTKSIKYDPYDKLRKPIAPPGHAIGIGKRYNRSKAKQEEKEIIEEELDQNDSKNS